MNFLIIEKHRAELSSFLLRITGTPKVLILFSFYEKLLESRDSNLINAYAQEFIDEYLLELDRYSPFYSEPDLTEKLLIQIKELKQLQILEKNFSN